MPEKGPPQPRHRQRVDLDAALEAAGPAMEMWRTAEAHPGAPLYSGGLLDSWPAWVVDALAICREEAAAVRTYLMAEQHRNGAKRG